VKPAATAPAPAKPLPADETAPRPAPPHRPKAPLEPPLPLQTSEEMQLKRELADQDAEINKIRSQRAEAARIEQQAAQTVANLKR
jgi:small-conductance mechanosensitive channel